MNIENPTSAGSIPGEKSEKTPAQFSTNQSNLEETPPIIHKNASRAIAPLALLAAALLWSTSFVVTKIGVADIPPLTFAALRYLFASVLICLIALLTRKVQRVPRRDLLRLGLGGLFGITAYYAFQNLGMQRTSAAEATLLVAAFPALTMLLEVVIFKKHFTLLRFGGVMLALGGVYLVICQTADLSHPQSLFGDVLLLACGIVWAFYNFVTQDVVKRYSMLTVTFWQMLFGTAALLPLALFEMPAWQPLTTSGILSTLYLGAFCSVAAYFVYGFGLRGMEPSAAVGMMNLVPIFGVGLAALVLHEQVTLVQIAGGLVVIVGVMLNMPVTPPATPPQGSPKDGAGNLAVNQEV